MRHNFKKKNMKNFKTIIACLAIATVTFSGCKKDKDDSNTDKLTDKNWKVTALTVDPPLNVGGTLVSNVYSQIPACNQNDLTIFKDNGSVTFDEGVTKCDPADPQSTQGTWTWNTNETILSITNDGDTDSYNVSSLSNDAMVASYTDNSFGIVETYTVTYTKQ